MVIPPRSIPFPTPLLDFLRFFKGPFYIPSPDPLFFTGFPLPLRFPYVSRPLFEDELGSSTHHSHLNRALTSFFRLHRYSLQERFNFFFHRTDLPYLPDRIDIPFLSVVVFLNRSFSSLFFASKEEFYTPRLLPT